MTNSSIIIMFIVVYSFVVLLYLKDFQIELELTEADDEWKGTRVGFILRNIKGITEKLTFIIPAGLLLMSITEFLLIAGLCISEY